MGLSPSLSLVRAYGENLRVLAGPVAVFDVTSAAVPCCDKCQRQLRRLTIFALISFFLPWIPVTVMALVSWFPPGVGPMEFLIAASLGMAVGLGLLGFRYWYVRGVRIQALEGQQARFAIRRENFAQGAATLNGTSVRRILRPVAW